MCIRDRHDHISGRHGGSIVQEVISFPITAGPCIINPVARFGIYVEWLRRRHAHNLKWIAFRICCIFQDLVCGIAALFCNTVRIQLGSLLLCNLGEKDGVCLLYTSILTISSRIWSIFPNLPSYSIRSICLMRPSKPAIPTQQQPRSSVTPII